MLQQASIAWCWWVWFADELRVIFLFGRALADRIRLVCLVEDLDQSVIVAGIEVNLCIDFPLRNGPCLSKVCPLKFRRDIKKHGQKLARLIRLKDGRVEADENSQCLHVA